MQVGITKKPLTLTDIVNLVPVEASKKEVLIKSSTQLLA